MHPWQVCCTSHWGISGLLLMSRIRLDASIIYAFMTSLDSVRHVRTLQIDFRNHDGSSPNNKYSHQQLCLDIVARKHIKRL